jgi:hypothetical protein
MAARDRITEVNEAVRGERERIRQLAIDKGACYSAKPYGMPYQPFADLLGPEEPS